MNIQKIFRDAKKDSELFEDLNINELVRSAEKAQYLENKTMDDLLLEKKEALEELDIDKATEKLWLKRLNEYRYVKNIYEIHKGKHLRWIRKAQDPLKLTNGAIVSEVKFLDNGTYIQCNTYQNNVFQIKMDDCILFQKLTQDELLILSIYDHIQTK
jgi:phage anti-repressor protein